MTHTSADTDGARGDDGQSLSPFFAPHSVAVIGASRTRGTISGELFHNLLRYEFTGALYPVNPNASVVQSVTAYRSVEEIPGA
ncbi:MAG: CoA-binding protein, partial [Gemmatimonas sp.]